MAGRMKQLGKDVRINGVLAKRMLCPEKGIELNEPIGGASNTIYFWIDATTGKITSTCSPEVAEINCIIRTPTGIGETSTALDPKKCPNRDNFIREFIPRGMEIGGIIDFTRPWEQHKTFIVRDKHGTLLQINTHNIKRVGNGRTSGKIIVKKLEGPYEAPQRLESIEHLFEDPKSVQYFVKRR